VPLSPEQVTRFAAYQRLLLEWNTKFNLTAITDPAEIERRLFLDALLLVPVIARLADPTARLVDIGSGAGFPGLPLAIVQPDRPVTLIEATGKKAAFLSHVIAELGLGQARARHARAEEFAHLPNERAGCDLVTARAVASLPSLIELAMPLLRVGGHAIFPKGLDLDEELAAGRRAAGLLGARISSDETVPAMATRIVVVTKERPTPDRYPRRAGIPAREPLGARPEGVSPEVAAGSPKANGHRRQSHPRQPAEDAARRRVAG
jgi:16S rRNA (guanine527-N7)-methyltransferase